MSRTTTKTYELRHPDTGHTVFADFGSRSFAHFTTLGYNYTNAEPAQEAEAPKPTKKPRSKPVVKETDNGNDNP